jgi:hypothetical protein
MTKIIYLDENGKEIPVWERPQKLAQYKKAHNEKNNPN